MVRDGYFWRGELEDMEGKVGENRNKDGIKSRNYKLEKTELNGLRLEIRGSEKTELDGLR